MIHFKMRRNFNIFNMLNFNNLIQVFILRINSFIKSRIMKYKTKNSYTGREDIGKYIYNKYQKVLKGKILDVGCSKQRSLEKELPKDCEYVGLDIIPEADIQLDLENIKTLPFDNDHFNVAVCSGVLEHIDNLHTVLSEVIRISHYLIISLPNSMHSLWDAMVSNQLYSNGLNNSDLKWLKFYGLPSEKPIDRHKWFCSYSEVKYFIKKIAERFNLKILQIDGESENYNSVLNTFNTNIRKLLLDTYGIEIVLPNWKFNRKRRQMIEDCCIGRIWALLKKNYNQ